MNKGDETLDLERCFHCGQTEFLEYVGPYGGNQHELQCPNCLKSLWATDQATAAMFQTPAPALAAAPAPTPAPAQPRPLLVLPTQYHPPQTIAGKTALAQIILAGTPPPAPGRSWKPGDVVPGRKCSRCKNESIRILAVEEREDDGSYGFTLHPRTTYKVLESVKVSCRLCGSDSGTIQAQDLPSA